MKAVMALLQRDIRGIYRDGFLIMMAFYSLMLALVTRIAVQWVPLDHADLYIAPFIVITACSLVGMVFGFGLIEERETRTWLLLRVVPVSPAVLTGYWIVTVSGFSFVISLVSVALYFQRRYF